MSKVTVLKIGGSFLLKEGKPDVSSLQEMAEVVLEILKEDQRFVIVFFSLKTIYLFSIFIYCKVC
jgi:uridylate kinase